MRKTRRHKYLQISVFFLIYSIIHVVSVSNKENDHDDAKSGNNVAVATKTQANASEEHQKSNGTQEKNSTEHHEHVAEKIMGHFHSSSGGHKNSTENHEYVTKNVINHLHNSVANSNSTEHHAHVADNIINHLHGSLGATSKNSTEHHEHVAEKIMGHFHSSSGGLKNSTENHEYVTKNVINHLHNSVTNSNSTVPTNVTKQGNATKEVATATKAGTKNNTKVLPGVKGGGTVKATHANGTKNSTSVNDTEEDCSQPAITQFPNPIMSLTTARHGGSIIHVLVAVYMFFGLAIVCDEYFVASLDRICEEMKMPPDVAGATFMAAGSSAPELATVIIGVFLAKDDIGISGVIGSAVFNIMFVISCCALCSSTVVYLNWWPLIRDCFFYAISILVLLLAIYDESVTWVESVLLLFTYVIYCIVLHYNTILESIAYTLPVPFRHTPPTEESGLVSYKTLDDDGKMPNYGMDWSPEKQQENTDQDLKNFGAEWSPEKNQPGFANQLSGPALNQATIEASPQQSAPPPRPIQQDYYKPKEYDPSTQVNPLIKPEGAGIYTLVTWAIVYPIHWLCRLTMPDCRTEKYKNWYPFTFFISMVWISFYSYFMVWMITLIGFTLYIPDTVMGLTFVAAGVSVPDALSSIAVIKEGYGDMAVSNAVGSNVFDILVCLGLPWFLKTAIVNPGTTVKVKSKGLTYSTVSLLSTVVFLVVATHMNGWKLDKRYGIILMIWYLIFIIVASIYEFSVYNPCPDVADWLDLFKHT